MPRRNSEGSRPERRKIVFPDFGWRERPSSNTHNYDQRGRSSFATTSRSTVLAWAAFLQPEIERLAKYAHDTGGELLWFEKPGDGRAVFQVTEEARNSTRWVCASRTDRSTEYHSIEVR